MTLMCCAELQIDLGARFGFDRSAGGGQGRDQRREQKLPGRARKEEEQGPLRCQTGGHGKMPRPPAPRQFHVQVLVVTQQLRDLQM